MDASSACSTSLGMPCALQHLALVVHGLFSKLQHLRTPWRQAEQQPVQARELLHNNMKHLNAPAAVTEFPRAAAHTVPPAHAHPHSAFNKLFVDAASVCKVEMKHRKTEFSS